MDKCVYIYLFYDMISFENSRIKDKNSKYMTLLHMIHKAF